MDFQDLALSFESAEEEILEKRPQSPKESIFRGILNTEVLLSEVVIGIQKMLKNRK